MIALTTVTGPACSAFCAAVTAKNEQAPAAVPQSTAVGVVVPRSGGPLEQPRCKSRSRRGRGPFLRRPRFSLRASERSPDATDNDGEGRTEKVRRRHSVVPPGLVL